MDATRVRVDTELASSGDTFVVYGFSCGLKVQGARKRQIDHATAVELVAYVENHDVGDFMIVRTTYTLSSDQHIQYITPIMKVRS